MQHMLHVLSWSFDGKVLLSQRWLHIFIVAQKPPEADSRKDTQWTECRVTKQS